MIKSIFNETKITKQHGSGDVKIFLTHARQAAGTVDGGARESMLMLSTEAGTKGIEWGSVVASGWPRTLYISPGDPFDDGEISWG